MSLYVLYAKLQERFLMTDSLNMLSVNSVLCISMLMVLHVAEFRQCEKRQEDEDTEWKQKVTIDDLSTYGNSSVEGTFQ